VEFLSHYKAKHGFTLKDRLVAHLPDYADAVSRIAVLANLRDRVPGLAWLSEKITGFSARRTLPRWRGDTFWAAHDRVLFSSKAETIAAAPKAAALFVDTFNGTFESENAHAAARVLKKAGYTLYLVVKEQGQHCCGRTFLAAGMVDKARAKLSALLDDVLPLARAGVAIVGLEPSCLLTLRDEALSMGLGETAKTVSAQALLLEEFLAREAKAGRFAPLLKPAPAPILLHGHCHQKAFGAVTPILEVLRLIPGAAPQLIETSCCGMAGSFGYDVDHYDVSMQMAELSLLPAVRQNPDAIIVADGTSCRHQIAHGAGRQARHVAVLLDELS
jgi:Fe-S oxidoreductase